MTVAIAVLILALTLLGVHCSPTIGLLRDGTINVPVKGIGAGQPSTQYQISLKKGELGINKHQETYSEKNDHSEQHDSATNQEYQNDGGSYRLRQQHKQIDKTHNSHDSQHDVQDQGLSLGLGGANAYDNRKHIEDMSTYDQETSETSSKNEDQNYNSRHSDESGTQRTDTSRTKVHKEEYNNKGFQLGGNKGGGILKKERGTSENREASNEESGKIWSRSNDYSKEGGTTRNASSEMASEFSKTDSEASAKSTHESEQENFPDNKQGNVETEFVPLKPWQHLYQKQYHSNGQQTIARQVNPGDQISYIHNIAAKQEYLQALRDKTNPGSWQNHQTGSVTQAGRVPQTGHITNLPGYFTNVLGHTANVPSYVINNPSYNIPGHIANVPGYNANAYGYFDNVPNYVNKAGYEHSGSQAQAIANSNLNVGSHTANLQAISLIYDNLHGRHINSQHPLFNSGGSYYDARKQHENSHVGVDNIQHYANDGSASNIQNGGGQIQNGYERQCNNQHINTGSSYAQGNKHNGNSNYNGNEYRSQTHPGYIYKGSQVIENEGRYNQGSASDTDTHAKQLVNAIRNAEDVVKEVKERKLVLHNGEKIIVLPGKTYLPRVLANIDGTVSSHTESGSYTKVVGLNEGAYANEIKKTSGPKIVNGSDSGSYTGKKTQSTGKDDDDDNNSDSFSGKYSKGSGKYSKGSGNSGNDDCTSGENVSDDTNVSNDTNDDSNASNNENFTKKSIEKLTISFNSDNYSGKKRKVSDNSENDDSISDENASDNTNSSNDKKYDNKESYTDHFNKKTIENVRTSSNSDTYSGKKSEGSGNSGNDDCTSDENASHNKKTSKHKKQYNKESDTDHFSKKTIEKVKTSSNSDTYSGKKSEGSGNSDNDDCTSDENVSEDTNVSNNTNDDNNAFDNENFTKKSIEKLTTSFNSVNYSGKKSEGSGYSDSDDYYSDESPADNSNKSNDKNDDNNASDNENFTKKLIEKLTTILNFGKKSEGSDYSDSDDYYSDKSPADNTNKPNDKNDVNNASDNENFTKKPIEKLTTILNSGKKSEGSDYSDSDDYYSDKSPADNTNKPNYKNDVNNASDNENFTKKPIEKLTTILNSGKKSEGSDYSDSDDYYSDKSPADNTNKPNDKNDVNNASDNENFTKKPIEKLTTILNSGKKSESSDYSDSDDYYSDESPADNTNKPNDKNDVNNASDNENFTKKPIEKLTTILNSGKKSEGSDYSDSDDYYSDESPADNSNKSNDKNDVNNASDNEHFK